jgi:hypothetical protein
MSFATLVLGMAAMVCPSPAVRAQTAPAKAGSIKSYQIDVVGTKVWGEFHSDGRILVLVLKNTAGG